jgi:hypothetical protein
MIQDRLSQLAAKLPAGFSVRVTVKATTNSVR